jgi:proton-translocating NADH-quinone oxidoreductase chain L
MFAMDYMYNDEKFYKFLSYLSLFTFFMAFMVTSPNIVQFFVGWEGIGLCSYLLINFWYFRPEANRSAMKAIIINKIGDTGLYIFMIFCVFFYKSFDFYVIFNIAFLDTTSIYIEVFGIKFTKLDILSVALVIAAIGKSSQLILHSWLPDAMEGPTPVSALLHSATMVTAGIFLLIRCSSIIDNSIYALNILAIVGIITSIVSSIMAMSQFDIKKSIAYSTTGQLAYMLTGCGFSSYVVSFQHLIDHAFFKAVLFLAAGSVIHSKLQGYQDIREFGKILKGMPITYMCFLISSLSLLGFPLTSGFYSKEAIIESIFLRTEFEQIISVLSAVSVAFTAYYSFQLIKLVFFSNNKKNFSEPFKESSFFITTPIVVLTLCGIYFGYLNNNIFSSDTNFFRESIFINDNYTENSFFFDNIT